MQGILWIEFFYFSVLVNGASFFTLPLAPDVDDSLYMPNFSIMMLFFFLGVIVITNEFLSDVFLFVLLIHSLSRSLSCVRFRKGIFVCRSWLFNRVTSLFTDIHFLSLSPFRTLVK